MKKILDGKDIYLYIPNIILAGDSGGIQNKTSVRDVSKMQGKTKM